MKKLMYLVAILAVLIIYSCGKDSSTSRIKINLTDAPTNVDAVNVEIVGIELHVEGDTTDAGGWITLEGINSGVYNLLDFQNGADTTLFDMEVTAKKINQVRLILGTDNTIVVDGEEFPLSTPSAQQSGLKIKVDKNLSDGEPFTFWLDFDAEESIVVNGNDSYILKPVLKLLLVEPTEEE